MTQNPYSPQPGAASALTPEQERTWAVGTHAATGAATALSAGTLGFVAALVVFLLYKDRGPFVRHHVANALNIQLNGLLWAVIGAVLVLVLVGFAVLAAVPIVMVVLHVLGAIAASRGEWTNPPLTIRFIR
jgi:hypothetical protein